VDRYAAADRYAGADRYAAVVRSEALADPSAVVADRYAPVVHTGAPVVPIFPAARAARTHRAVEIARARRYFAPLPARVPAAPDDLQAKS
jgi:hypothetical protein